MCGDSVNSETLTGQSLRRVSRSSAAQTACRRGTPGSPARSRGDVPEARHDAILVARFAAAQSTMRSKASGAARARRLGTRDRSRPVASAVPPRMTAQPTSIVRVTVSPRNSPPHSIAKAGIRKVTVIAVAGPTRAISRKYRMYAIPVHNTPSAIAAAQSLHGGDARATWRSQTAAAAAPPRSGCRRRQRAAGRR